MMGLYTKPVKRGCQGRRAKRNLTPRKEPSAESQWFDARDRANKNVKAEKRSVPLHSCTGLRQKPGMRRWRGNYLFIWSAYGHRNF